jgi:hypothetical protein
MQNRRVKNVKGSAYGTPSFDPINPVLQSRTKRKGTANVHQVAWGAGFMVRRAERWTSPVAKRKLGASATDCKSETLLRLIGEVAAKTRDLHP